jgi:hypothetical protein
LFVMSLLVAGAGSARAGVLGVTQFWASHIGEVVGMVANLPYYLPLTQHDNLDLDPNDAFTTLGCRGSVTGLRVSSQFGGQRLDTGENLNVTLRKCTGFTADGACIWSATDFAIPVRGDGETATWTDVQGGTSFAPGDMLGIELVCPAPCDQPDSVEWPVYVVETRCDDPDTSVVGASFPAHAANLGRAFPVTGWSTRLLTLEDSSEARSRCPVPGDFRVAGMTVSSENDDVAITYSLCRYDGTSDDANCGGTDQGEELMAVSWSAGEGVREKTSAACLARDCELSAGDVVFLHASAAPSPSAGVGVGIALTSSERKWMSGIAGNINTRSVYEATMSGAATVAPCAVPGPAKCQADVLSDARATAFYSRIHRPLQGATWVSEVLDNLTSTDLEVTHDDTGAPVAQIKSDTGTASIAAGDTFLVQQTSGGVSGTVGYCQTLLWDDLDVPEPGSAIAGSAALAALLALRRRRRGA